MDAFRPMQVHRHANAEEFLKHAKPWLLEAEPENNLMFGVAGRSTEEAFGGRSDEYWATVCDGNEIVGTAFRTPPWHLAVSRMPAPAIRVLADDVWSVYPDLSGVVGPAEVSEPFARLWVKRHGGSWHRKFRQRIHVLQTVERVAEPPAGSLRQMIASDEPLIREWMLGFVRDTGIIGLPENLLQSMLHKRVFYLWEDNEPRCLVARGRETPNGVCINAVYTPVEQRCRGYATAAVAALSETILSSGCRFCCLYTDLDNPTSNSIYRKIGYQPVRDDMELVFERA